MIELAAALDGIAARLGAGRAEVAAFLHETAGRRIAARAWKISEAARRHDERPAAPPLAVAPAPERSRPSPPAVQPAPERRWGRRAAIAAALGALGAALGAATIAWLIPAPPDPVLRSHLSAGVRAAVLQPALAQGAPVKVDPGGKAAPPAPSPTASPASARSPAPRAASPHSDTRARLRLPGF
jgi:hypothetical protein